MMKYLSVIGFAIFMSWTWAVINSEPAISLETHVGIQNRLAALIRDSILTKKPQASQITIQDLWTEPVSEGTETQIRAHFAYRFNEPDSSGQGSVGSELTGEALLLKQDDENSHGDRWVIKDFKSTSEAIAFDQPLVIATGDESAPMGGVTPSPAEPAKTATPAEKAKE